MLTNPYFADFTARYGELGARASDEERRYLARLYWFTVEFGLIKEADEMRIFGGGILSSIGETKWSLEEPTVERRPLDMLDALRTPYRIDIMQPIYYYIKSMEDLGNMKNDDIMYNVKEAMKLGMFEPTFPPKP